MHYIRKGTSRVTIPFQLRSSSKAMAQWANQVRQGMLELRDRMPQANVKRGGGGGSTEPFWTTLRKTKDSLPENPVYEIIVSLGYVEYQNANATSAPHGVTGWLVPSVNGVELDAPLSNPAIEIPGLVLSGLVNYVYLVVNTTADGDPKFGISDCTVQIFSEPQKSTHHIRPSPDGGETEGIYYFLIADTAEVPDSDPPRPKINRRITGNRFLPNQLVEIANLEGEGGTSKYELYKGYVPDNNDKHEFRVLEQIGDGVPVIRPLAPEKPAVPPVVDESGNVVKPGVPRVPPEEQGDTVRFRSIKEKSTQAQIHVRTPEGEDTEKAEIIEIVGNDFDEDIFSGVKEISVKDGLVTKLVGFGDAGNMNLIAESFTIITEPPYIRKNSDTRTFYFRNGFFVGTDITSPEPPPVTGDSPLSTEYIAKIG